MNEKPAASPSARPRRPAGTDAPANELATFLDDRSPEDAALFDALAEYDRAERETSAG